MSVPVNTQPHHIPARVVGIPNAKYRERRLVHVFMPAPIKRQRPALRIDISRRPVREQLVVTALYIRTLRSAGRDLHVGLIVRHRVATRGVVRLETVVAGEIEQQPRLLRRCALCQQNPGRTKEGKRAHRHATNRSRPTNFAIQITPHALGSVPSQSLPTAVPSLLGISFAAGKVVRPATRRFSANIPKHATPRSSRGRIGTCRSSAFPSTPAPLLA